jgi:hypothetical protein
MAEDPAAEATKSAVGKRAQTVHRSSHYKCHGRRKAVKHCVERFLAKGPNQAWSIDFFEDLLRDGR